MSPKKYGTAVGFAFYTYYYNMFVDADLLSDDTPYVLEVILIN
jgi:hypothetical protein